MISVIIPLYNKENFIETAVLSVLNQSFKDFELIIVNDGSTDGGLQIVTNIKDTRIKIVSQNNKGVSAARNLGITFANFELVAFLDGDDKWDTHFLDEMFRLSKDYPLAALFGCACSYSNSNVVVSMSNYGIAEGFRGYVEDYFKIGVNNTLYNSSSVLLRKDAFIELGGFDESLAKGEDIELWIKFALNKKLAYINAPLSYYILDAENRTSRKKIDRKKCLIWNLERFSQYETSIIEFKKFIDGWRLAHISNYLEGDRNEVDEINEILKTIDLNNYSIFYKILLVLPAWLHTPFYNFWNFLKNKNNH